MKITINTETKTLILEESVKFIELQEFVGNFNLKDYTIITSNKDQSSLVDYLKRQKDYVSPYTPPYKVSYDPIYKPDQRLVGSTDNPLLHHPSTTSWEPTGPLKS